MSKQTHYDIEDLPAQDADTQVELYRQAQELVADSGRRAQHLFQDIEAKLRALFHKAERDGDEVMMALINESYDCVQSMAALSGQQGAALNGANGAIDALQAQRDRIADELKGLVDAIGDADINHPQLVELYETIQEWEAAYANHGGLVVDRIAGNLHDLLVSLRLKQGFQISTHRIAYRMVEGLQEHHTLTTEQRELILALARTFDSAPAQGGA